MTKREDRTDHIRQDALDAARGLDADKKERAGQTRQKALEMSRHLAEEGTSILRETEPPRQEWELSCGSFERAHRGWIITLREMSTSLLERDPARAQKEGHELARGEALSDVRLVEEDGDTRIELRVGEGPDASAHVIEEPVRVLVERTSDGADAGLRVDDEEGCSSVLRFRVPARPADLDGLAPAER
jgi:hypothetical protein